MLDILQTACEALMKGKDRHLFWILPDIAERSSEEGNHTKFLEVVSTFEVAGFPKACVRQLRQGVNGGLASTIESLFPDLGPFQPNTKRISVLPVGHESIGSGIYKANRERINMKADIRFGKTDSPWETLSEVKVLHDWTTPPFYGHKGEHGVADDADKLRRIRIEPFKGHLLQIVFFIHLPNYSYCSGKSYEEPPHKCREYYLYTHGIRDQYERVLKNLTQEPTWPKKGGPEIVPLRRPEKSICDRLEQWMAKVFRPDDRSWKFKAAEQLANAAVGYAIWEY